MKKITKFLDSVMGGIKRTCIAKALAVFAVASIAINANAQATNEQGVITGMQDLVGLTEEQVRDNLVTSSSTFPTSPEKQFFLYNVGTGRFLNAGGYWGTHVSLQEYGKPIAAIDGGKSTQTGAPNVARLNFFTDMSGAATQGKFIGFVGVPGDPNVQAEEDNGVWLDRKTEEIFGWVIEPTGDDDKNTFRIYTYAHSTFKDGQYVLDYSKKYYLCSNKGVVDAAKNCEAYSEDDLNDYSGYDTWRIFSYKQILDLQVQNASDFTDALELSFKLKCPGFSRGDNDIKSWNTYNYNINKTFLSDPKNNTGHEFARYGLQYYYNNKIAGPNTTNEFTAKSLPSGGYTFNGKTYTGLDKDFHRDLSKYYCASITNKRGVLYQDIVVTLDGTYQIECKGFSTTKKAKLFAGVLDPNDAKKETMLDKALNATPLNQVSNMLPAVKEALHVSEKNVDYAGKNFYGTRDFVNTIYVTVPKSAIKNGEATIRLGIMIGDNQNDKTPVTTGDGEWTVFDDFRMLYAERVVNEDLILDEMRDNLTYLVNCPTPMKNKTLRLNKTFTLGKWNSFILPVNLNKKQVTEAFGGSARLAKLTGLTESGIEFTSVNLLDDNTTAIEAYVPYIIFPVKGPGQTKTYTANYKQNGASERLNINIPANHYVIGKVSMLLTADGKANDWSKMDQTKWTTTLTGGNDDIKAYGTFARTFGTEQTDKEDGTYTWTNDGTIIDGRDDLKDCYFFDKGNMYHSSSDPNKYRPRGLRGFSCWFKTEKKPLRLTIDGVSQGTTGIEDILADYEQPVSRFANGIYNLNGQLVKQGNSTAGLPSGLYIVNGKKCIVR